MILLTEDKVKRIFSEHGVILEPAGDDQFIGVTPFAPGERKKFYVHRTKGLWDCKVSGRKGSIQCFFREKGRINHERLKILKVPLKELADNRGLPTSALLAWGVGWDGYQYTLPAQACGRTYDLRRYRIGQGSRSTTGASASISGPLGLDWSSHEVIWLCEGEWDGMAMWTILRDTNTKGIAVSVPGAGVLPPHAIPFFRGKKVRVLFDHDQAGEQGSRRVQKILSGVADEVTYIHWEGDRPDGYDLRDLYCDSKHPKDALDKIYTLLHESPPGMGGGDGQPGSTNKLLTLEEELAGLTGKGASHLTTVNCYRTHLYLPDSGLLDIIFGTLLANRIEGDPVWTLLVAPPGGTKTELLRSLAGSPLVYFLSTLTPRTLASGGTAVGGGDASLLPKLNGRTLVLKDFTTILSLPQPQRDEIFGTLREAYDGTFQKCWGTGESKTYNSKFGVLAGVTPVVERFSGSASVLGERFIRYRNVLPQRMTSDDHIVDAALNNLNKETKLREDLQHAAVEVLNRPVHTETIPTIPSEYMTKIRKLAQWVARLRGAVCRQYQTNVVEFKPIPEVGTRLAKQFAKLGQGIAFYHGKSKIDDAIYQRLVSVGKSTIRDYVEEVVQELYLSRTVGGDLPLTVTEMVKKLNMENHTLFSVLQDLVLLKIVRSEKGEQGTRYTLTATVRTLMHDLQLYTREKKLYRMGKKETINE